jgi:hypothetical protein
MWITFFAIMIAVAICLSVAAFIMQPVTHFKYAQMIHLAEKFERAIARLQRLRELSRTFKWSVTE